MTTQARQNQTATCGALSLGSWRWWWRRSGFNDAMLNWTKH